MSQLHFIFPMFCGVVMYDNNNRGKIKFTQIKMNSNMHFYLFIALDCN